MGTNTRGIKLYNTEVNRGRDAHYWAPPAQNRTGGIPAYGSHLGCLTRKRTEGQGWDIRGLGSQRFASRSMSVHVVRSLWLRLSKARRHRSMTWWRNADSAR